MESNIKGYLYKMKKKITRKTIIRIIIFLFLFLFGFPVVLSELVFSPKVLHEIPGTSEDWFGFWATHLGSTIALGIALFTWYQGYIHKKENDEFRNNQEQLIGLLLYFNINIKGISVRILPNGLADLSIQYYHLEGDSTGLNESSNMHYYEFRIHILDKAMVPFTAVEMQKFTLMFGTERKYEIHFVKREEKTSSIKIEHCLNDMELIFYVMVPKDSNEAKDLAMFYMYDSWLTPQHETCIFSTDKMVFKRENGKGESADKSYKISIKIRPDGMDSNGVRKFKMINSTIAEASKEQESK